MTGYVSFSNIAKRKTDLVCTSLGVLQQNVQMYNILPQSTDNYFDNLEGSLSVIQPENRVIL